MLESLRRFRAAVGRQRVERLSSGCSTRRRLTRAHSRAELYLVRPVLLRLETVIATQYRQTEALAGLYATLDVRRPLPPLRGSAVSPDFAREVALMVLAGKPRTIVELGSGASTIVTGYALRRAGEGRIFSLEHDAHWLEETSALVRAHGLDDVVTVVHAPLRKHDIAGSEWMWYDLASIDWDEPIDLLIVDGPPCAVQAHARYPALPLLRDLLSPAAIIMLDDAGRPEEAEIVKRWTHEFGPFSIDRPETEKGLCVLRREIPVSPDVLASQ